MHAVQCPCCHQVLETNAQNKMTLLLVWCAYITRLKLDRNVPASVVPDQFWRLLYCASCGQATEVIIWCPEYRTRCCVLRNSDPSELLAFTGNLLLPMYDGVMGAESDSVRRACGSKSSCSGLRRNKAVKKQKPFPWLIITTVLVSCEASEPH